MDQTTLWLIGYVVSASAVRSYMTTHHLATEPPSIGYEALANHLQSRLPMRISVATDLGDYDNVICCFARWTDNHYDHTELLNVPIPDAFTRLVPQILSVQGGPYRIVRRHALVRGVVLYNPKYRYTQMNTADSVRYSVLHTTIPVLLPIPHQPIYLPPLASTHLRPCYKPSPLPLPPVPPSFSPLQSPQKLDSKENPLNSSYPSRKARPPLIHALPFELVAKIMTFLQVDPPAPYHFMNLNQQLCAITMSHIDSRFRSISLALPSLWKSIYINHSRRSRKLAALCCDRSGGCSLSVHLHLQEKSRGAMSLLLSRTISSRLEVLKVTCTPETFEPLQTFLNKLNAPELKDLALISDSGESWRITGLPQAPQLTTLTLKGVTPALRLANMYPNLDALHVDTRLCQRPCLSINTVMKVINNCAHLHTIVLEQMFPLCRRFNTEPLPRVLYLPALLNLTFDAVHSRYIVHLMSNLEAPNLRTLGIKHLLEEDWVGSVGKEFRGVHTLDLTSAFEWLELPSRGQALLLGVVQCLPNVTRLISDGSWLLDAWSLAHRRTLPHTEARYRSLEALSELEFNCDLGYFGGMGDLEGLCDFVITRKAQGYPRLKRLSLNFQSDHPSTSIPDDTLLSRLFEEVDQVETSMKNIYRRRIGDRSDPGEALRLSKALN